MVSVICQHAICCEKDINKHIVHKLAFYQLLWVSFPKFMYVCSFDLSSLLHLQGIDLRKDRQALQRLTEAAEKAKMELSSVSNTSISLPFITATADGPKHIETNLTRAKFEEMCSDLLDRYSRLLSGLCIEAWSILDACCKNRVRMPH